MLTDLLQSFINGVSNIGNVADMLPGSPFNSINAVKLDNQILASIAWFIPFNEMIALLNAWLAAIVVWYLAKKALRWMKMIQ